MKYLPKRFSLCLLAAFLLPATFETRAGVVTIGRDQSGTFTLLRNGEPMYIRGAGGTGHLADLKKYGGNSIRTWEIASLEEKVDGKRFIDRCEELGISVTAGIWIAHARHGFDYSDPAQLQKQRDQVREKVRKYRNHPALLMWGLGNEMEGPTSDGNDPRIWKELEVLAGIVREEDPNHPVMSVIAGVTPIRVKAILEYYPSIDVLGVNAYNSAPGIAARLAAAGWEKPFVLSEFGPVGDWEVPKTSWGAPIEPGSREKAEKYYSTLALTSRDPDNKGLGSYCFLWGNKQETTSSWYGMFLPTGEKLPQVDAVCRFWTGAWPENRCPVVRSIESSLKESVVRGGRLYTAGIEVTDPEGDELAVNWTVTAESTDTRDGGDKESVPLSFPECTVYTDGTEAVIKTPAIPGNYRLFVTVKDGRGNASIENLCFRVE